MKQRYYFAKLACESSATTSTELCRFFRQADLLRVQAFLTNLQQVSTPPVLYFGAYLDYWSSGLRFSELGKLADSYSWEGLPSLQVAVFQDTAYLKLDSLTEEWKRQFQEDSGFLGGHGARECHACFSSGAWFAGD